MQSIQLKYIDSESLETEDLRTVDDSDEVHFFDNCLRGSVLLEFV